MIFRRIQREDLKATHLVLSIACFRLQVVMEVSMLKVLVTQRLGCFQLLSSNRKWFFCFGQWNAYRTDNKHVVQVDFLSRHFLCS